MPHLIVFSHLRWDFVYQRPQHLLSRIARQHAVLFVEEPVHGEGAARFECSSPMPNVTVLRPCTPVRAAGFHDDQLKILKPLLMDHLREHLVQDYMVWFYTPMALPLLAQLSPRAVVYDCMDELSGFKGAPRQMRQREAALLKSAQLVLTGGNSLYEAKRHQHANVLCLPSAVDAEHYSPCRAMRDESAMNAARQLQDTIARPRLGFFGVIDERLDLELVARLADEEPGWQIVMVGPVVKIAFSDLPLRPNIHWLGHQPYNLLPQLIAGWDVCLMPFALNDATRFISPTKTLEYMAAEKPVVSTAVQDVVSMYGDAVLIAADTTSFIAACRSLLDEQPVERAGRLGRMLQTVSRHSWDQAAAIVLHEISQVLRLTHEPLSPDAAVSPDTQAASLASESGALTVHPGRRSRRHIIIGAGPTGLSAAYHLGLDGRGQDALLVEREPTVGGWCRSVKVGGYTFDHAGHIMFSNDPYVLQLYEHLLGDNIHWQNREAWVYSHEVYTRYPFQGSLYGLPPKVLKDCLIGAIEAHFGSLKDTPAEAAQTKKAPRNFEEFIHHVWGTGIAAHFAIPYNTKLWAVPLHEMETSWLGGRVPLPDLEQMLEGALEPTPAPMGPNARFGYPLTGGFQALMDGFLPLIQGEVALNTGVVNVSPRSRTVRLDDGRILEYETLISTMPLPQLVAACGSQAPDRVQTAAKALRHVSVRCVNLGVARPAITEKHWVYYPEDTVFHRIFMQGNASPHCNAPGGFGLTCEITYSPGKPLPCDGQALIDRCIADCRKVGLLRDDDVVNVAQQVDMPCAYVVYDHERAHNVGIIRDWLSAHGVVLAGRYSEWEYYNSDHAFLAGKRAAAQALGGASSLAKAAG